MKINDGRVTSGWLARAPMAIAHRGGSALAPENTLPAFEHARLLGADAVECDVHLSKDGVPVVIHDATLDRTTDATGPVAARTADELAAVDAAYRFGGAQGFPYRGQGIGVPRLEAVLARVAPLPVVIEIKGDRPEVAERALAVVAEARALDRVVVGGFSHEVLTAVRRRHPGLPTGASRTEVQSAVRRAYVYLAPRSTGYAVFQVPLRLAGRRVVTPRFVRLARRAGIPVQVWVVDDPAEMAELLASGVQGLISDRPDLAVRAVAAARSGRRQGEFLTLTGRQDTGSVERDRL